MPKTLKKKTGQNDDGIKKYSHLEHVLKIPDTYIGSVEKTQENHWYFNQEKGIMERKLISYTPGEYKIFDEILVNALDQVVRIFQRIQNGEKGLKPVKNIWIEVEQEAGCIKVKNDGEGISIKKHSEEGIYIPELIFGHLLTSGNYEKKGKITGGKNGYGGKLANIFSTKFIVETVNHKDKKKYIQTFTNNMKDKEEPIITKSSSSPYTQITYYPDFKKFGSENMEEDMITLIKKRVYDAAGITDKSVNIYYNGEKLVNNNFEKYVNLYIGDSPRVYSEFGERWSICIATSPTQQFEQISFVNGITTYQGGKHVEYITNQVSKKLSVHLDVGS